MAGSDTRVTIEGRTLKLTSLDRVLYPETGTTKADVLAYYAEVAPVMLPHVRDRPATRKRWVDGVGTAEHPGAVFFQKNLDASTPEWVARVEVQHSDHVNTYPLVNDAATLAWLAQISSLEIHVPQWRVGRTGAPKRPDRLVLDLDPGPGVGLPECAEVARLARSILQGAGLDPLPVTSGSKGIHLYSALDGSLTSEQASQLAHELARALEADHPELVVSDMKKAKRTGRVLVDWSQNSGAKTTVAPYSLRGRSRPMVAAPRTWRELASPSLRHLDHREVLRRAREKGDLLAPLEVAYTDDDDEDDRLATYRSMRDARRTPEPVPSAVPPPTDGRRFVIQEHHARRLHWDVRLERDGVLVSWAVPKGPPDDPAVNRLAVPTEDHPIEYLDFEGTIPAGEYGAGEMTIWDAGTYDLEKWRDGEEVIATLHGRRGSHRYALIRTGDRAPAGVAGPGRAQWIMHLMDEAPAERSGPASGERLAPRAGRRVLHGSGQAAAAARAGSSAVAPMLATAGTPADIVEPEAWAFEMKWDGIRALAHLDGGGLALRSRNGVDLTSAYPELAALPDLVERSVRAAGPTVLDGEIVALDARGRPDFGLLQRRMGLTKPREIAAMVSAVPVQVMLFDVVVAGGEDAAGLDYDARRELLTALVTASGSVQVPPAFDGALDAALTTSRELGLEGVMAKRRDSVYRPGRRSSAWIKLKHVRSQSVVVGGWRPGAGRRGGGIGSLLVGVPQGRGLAYAGRVGSGFGERELDALRERLRALETTRCPFTDIPASDARDAIWLRPELVGEVSFTEWTGPGRLRHPVWRGWRADVDPGSIVRE
ncbi:ATP-dependent DNA ligase [Microcella alkalica]|uniref:ATP-dependent DNA ligase n=1 Tax=Microcella alkalica TaxID=355930 RepID=UPI00145EFD84|nr:ATP-dependent DNA ligase [Microcella alkalica]